jgi:hypothetical protein
MKIKKNSMKGHSLVLFLIDDIKNRLSMNRLWSDIAHSLSPKFCTRLHEKLEPFETKNSTQFARGYASSSHYQIVLILVLEELS